MSGFIERGESFDCGELSAREQSYPKHTGGLLLGKDSDTWEDNKETVRYVIFESETPIIWLCKSDNWYITEYGTTTIGQEAKDFVRNL